MSSRVKNSSTLSRLGMKHQHTRIQKAFYAVVASWFPVGRKIQNSLQKKIMGTFFWGQKVILLINFFDSRSIHKIQTDTVRPFKSFIRPFKVQEEGSWQWMCICSTITLDFAMHTKLLISTVLIRIFWTILPIAPTRYQVTFSFTLLKNYMGRKCFLTDEEVANAVCEWSK